MLILVYWYSFSSGSLFSVYVINNKFCVVSNCVMQEQLQVACDNWNTMNPIVIQRIVIPIWIAETVSVPVTAVEHKHTGSNTEFINVLDECVRRVDELSETVT